MVDVASGAAFLLCRRTSRLNSHTAQWALPGERRSRRDRRGCRAAELHEEVGIKLPDESVLGPRRRPRRSGYVITPVVMWGGGRLDPQPSPDEVLAVYRVRAAQLQRPDSPRFISIPE